MRVLIAYDGSDGAQAALEDLQLAGLGQNVEVTILSVAEVWLPLPETSLGIDRPFPARQLRRESKSLQKMKRSRRVNV